MNQLTSKSSMLNRRAYALSVFTVVYNSFEGIISIVVGLMAGSIALAGFGLDSAVETISGMIMIWRFTPSEHPERAERRESIAEKLVGYSFFVFGVYVLYESGSKLFTAEQPEPTLIGIVIAAVSMISMPILFKMKRDTGRALGSRALIADSKETLACFYLSISLMVGLGANYVWGIWWADPAVGILIALFLFREGWEIFEERRGGSAEGEN